MLRATYMRLRPRHRRSLKFLSALPTPAVKRSWGQLGSLTREERQEVTSGSWRHALPVELVPDLADSAQPHSSSNDTVSRTMSARTETPLAFESDEAAEAYVAEETADEQAEATIPALRLASDFFTDLAALADEEIDREAAGLDGPTPQSDEDRRAEEAAVHRQFFLEYYERQRLLQMVGIGSGRGIKDSEVFARALMQPAPGLFHIRGDRVLSRLTVRDQLECDAAAVFHGTPNVMFYRADAVPAQASSEPLQLPAAHERAILTGGSGSDEGSRTFENAAAAIATGGIAPTVTIDHADVLGRMMLDDIDAVPASAEAPLPMETESTTAEVVAAPPTAISPVVATASVPRRRPPPHTQYRPLSAGHLHWLQRLVAADRIACVDLLSPVVSLLCTRLAAPAASTDGSGCTQRRPRVVFDPLGLAQRPATATSYYCDVAHSAAMTDANAGSYDEAARDVVVAVALPFQQRSVDKRHGDYSNDNDSDSAADDLMLRTPAASIPFNDRGTNLVYLEPPAIRKGRHHRQRPWTCPQLVGQCDVVLCAPRTSEDGARPQMVLGDGVKDDSEEEENEGASVPVPNRFLTVCAEAGECYERLKKSLNAAIAYVRRDGGWVLYTTRSMNPIENEAVVCAVLSTLRSSSPANAPQRPVVTCVPLTSEVVLNALTPEEAAELRSWLAYGGSRDSNGTGFTTGCETWVALEGAPADQEADRHDPALRAQVAAASWRCLPTLSSFDGSYVCLLYVQGGFEKAADTKCSTNGGNVGNVNISERSGFASIENESRSLELWAPARKRQSSHPSNGSGGCVSSLLTPAALAVTTALASAKDIPGCWRIACAGLPVASGLDTSAKPSELFLSSAASGTAALGEWITRLGGKDAPPIVPVSALMLSELLRRRQLHARPLHRRLRQLTDGVSGDDVVADAIVLSEVQHFLHTIGGIVAATAASEARPSTRHTVEVVRTIVLRPFVPRHAVAVITGSDKTVSHRSSGSARGGCVPYGALHEAVEAELASLLIVARLEASVQLPRAAPKHKQSDSFVDFILSVTSSLPQSSPERPVHEAAIAESSVGIRDSLQYVLRRVGCPVNRLLLGDRVEGSRDGLAGDPYGKAMTSISGDVHAAATVATVDQRGAPRIAHLADDDYSIESNASPMHSSSSDGADLLSRRERQQTSVRLRRMEHALRRQRATPAGAAMADDWAHSVPAAYRQRRRGVRAGRAKCS